MRRSISATAAGGDLMFISDRKSTRLNSSHVANSYAAFCLKKKNHHHERIDAAFDAVDDQRVRDLVLDVARADAVHPFAVLLLAQLFYVFFFFFNDTATTEIYTLSLHDALPI